MLTGDGSLNCKNPVIQMYHSYLRIKMILVIKGTTNGVNYLNPVNEAVFSGGKKMNRP